MTDARMFWNVQHARTDQHQVEPARVHLGIPLEMLEQFGAALVLVDPADVEREGAADVELLLEAAGLRVLRNLRSHADDDARPLPLADVQEQRPFLGRVKHDGPGTAQHRTKNAQADSRIALRRRDQDGLLVARPHAVPGVVIAHAEEDQKVERLGRPSQVLDE